MKQPKGNNPENKLRHNKNQIASDMAAAWVALCGRKIEPVRLIEHDKRNKTETDTKPPTVKCHAK